MDGWTYHAGAQIKALTGLGFKGPIISTDSEIVSEVIEVSGLGLTEGYAAASWEMGSPDMKPVFKEDFLKYVKKSGNTNAWLAWGWNTMWVLAQAIEGAQSLDPVKVADYLHKDAKNLKTLFGPAFVSGEKSLGIRAAVSTQQATFGVMPSILLVVYLLAGGKANFAGPIIGTAILYLIPYVMGGFQGYAPFFQAGALIAVVFFIPEGMISLPAQIRSGIRKQH
jgi:hypothetical protein